MSYNKILKSNNSKSFLHRLVFKSLESIRLTFTISNPLLLSNKFLSFIIRCMEMETTQCHFWAMRIWLSIDSLMAQCLWVVINFPQMENVRVFRATRVTLCRQFGQQTRTPVLWLQTLSFSTWHPTSTPRISTITPPRRSWWNPQWKTMTSLRNR